MTKKRPGRNWATIIYPENHLDCGWIDNVLRSAHIPCYISPLHDRDVKENGEPKKPHYHVLFCFRGNKSEASVKVIVDAIGGVGIERISDRHVYARYLCHLDDLDKARYKTDDIRCIGGTDYRKFLTCRLTFEDSVTDIFKIINGYGMTSFRQVVNYCCTDRPDLLNIIIKNAYAIKMYMKESEE